VIGDVAIWLVFTAELVSMLRVALDKRAYLHQHPLDVAIVVLTPPLAPTILQSVRLLRVVRVLRVFRLAPALSSVFSLAGVGVRGVSRLPHLDRGWAGLLASREQVPVAGRLLGVDHDDDRGPRG
jgi:hypothetical protein